MSIEEYGCKARAGLCDVNRTTNNIIIVVIILQAIGRNSNFNL
jgi:hypothetical protein